MALLTMMKSATTAMWIQAMVVDPSVSSKFAAMGSSTRTSSVTTVTTLRRMPVEQIVPSLVAVMGSRATILTELYLALSNVMMAT
jgi:hypothetical protein